MIFWLSRTYACFLGFFLLLTLSLGMVSFHNHAWWFNLTFLPFKILQIFFILLFSMGLLSFAIFPPKRKWQQMGILFIFLAFLIFSGVNVVSYYQLLYGHQIFSGPIVPFSLLIFISLLFLTWVTIKIPVWLQRQTKRLPIWFFIGCTALFAILFPILQIFCFGRTDYRRSADAIVVFGAKTYANGAPSRTLANRVITACHLYKQGYAKTLIFSGGPGTGAIYETDAMKTLAIQQGVQPQDILLDPQGLNTQATVKNTLVLFHQFHLHRILVVSDFSHLPRIKLAYQLAGQEVYTVPAKEFPRLSLLLFQLGREVFAFWSYYFRMGRF